MDQSLPPFELPPRGDHPVEVYHRAWELLRGSAPMQALELLGPAIEQEPGSSSLRTLRAWAYFMSAQLGNAEVELGRLVEENPTDLWARFTLGRVLERQARYAEALPHFRLAAVMSGDPEHEAAVLRCERKLAESRPEGYDDLV
jgi:Flp pilus assembly protein TadD